ncbi:Retinoblastoma-associated protein, partial [Stegodyphus mimosarum]
MDFFSVTCVLKSNHNLSDNSRQNLIALERKYLIVSALYDKFESMVAEIFSIDSGLPNHSKQNISCDQGNASNQLMKHHRTLCWMLFIVAKAKVLWHRQELLATFHLLLCCIGEVVKITPTFLLLPPFDSVVAKSESSLTVLEVLSSHVKTKFEE